MTNTCDVAIIGAGIVGAACAYELTNTGLRVVVIDPHEPGSGASNAGMGHLVLMDDSPAQFALTSYSLELWRKLFPLLPADCEFWKCGTVWVAEDEKELRFLAGRAELAARNGIAAQLLDRRGLIACEPNLKQGFSGGLLMPSDASVRPPAVARFLIQRAIAKGAALKATRAGRIDDDGVHCGDGTFLYAGSTIVATGTAAPELIRRLPIRPRKGHVLVVEAGPQFARHQVLETGYIRSTHAEEADSVAFNVRHTMNGELLVGSSRQYDVADAAVEPAVLGKMLRRAIKFMPALANARPLRNWTGLRAATPDGLPLIGRCTDFRRVYGATGHEGLGATTAPATARLLADMILGETPAIDPTPYLPARFVTRESVSAQGEFQQEGSL